MASISLGNSIYNTNDIEMSKPKTTKVKALGQPKIRKTQIDRINSFASLLWRFQSKLQRKLDKGWKRSTDLSKKLEYIVKKINRLRTGIQPTPLDNFFKATTNEKILATLFKKDLLTMCVLTKNIPDLIVDLENEVRKSSRSTNFTLLQPATLQSFIKMHDFLLTYIKLEGSDTEDDEDLHVTKKQKSAVDQPACENQKSVP